MRWTTIGLSAAAQDALANESPPRPADWKKRIATVWIPAILGLGLIMAFAYVGVRIVAGKPQVQSTVSPAKIESPIIKAPVNVPVQAAPKPATPKPAPKSIDLEPKAFTLVTPQPGERYLQVAAVTPHMVLTYVDTLRKVSLDAVVAPGPTPDLLRILVGPFSDQNSMDQAKAQLEAAGKSPIIRSY
jgi:cell division septation protein DedD